MFDARSMLKAAGINVTEMEERFRQLQETVQAGYVAFVEVQATVIDLRASNARLEDALLILLKDRNEAREIEALKNKVAHELASVEAQYNGEILDIKRSE